VREVFADPVLSGTVTEDPLSNNVALVISQGTASRGRSYRGRTYHCGIPETFAQDAVSMFDANRIGALTGWINWWDAMAAVDGSTHVVLSRYTGNAPRATGVMTPITTVSANGDFDSMRKRLAGRGS